jgi:chromatin-remodeling ATPase INO80
MSFASILSEPAEDLSPRRPSLPLPPAPPSITAEKNEAALPEPTSPTPIDKKPNNEKRRRIQDRDNGYEKTAPLSANGVVQSTKTVHQQRVAKSRRSPTEKDMEAINKVMAEIENSTKSDVESSGFENELERYVSKGKKRALETERTEAIKRKVCLRVLCDTSSANR